MGSLVFSRFPRSWVAGDSKKECNTGNHARRVALWNRRLLMAIYLGQLFFIPYQLVEDALTLLNEPPHVLLE